MKILFIYLCLLIPLNSFSDEIDDFLEGAGDSELASLEELNEGYDESDLTFPANFEVVDQISDDEFQVRKPKVKKYKEKTKAKDWTPVPFKAAIKPGSLIYAINSDKKFYIKRKMYVRARLKVGGSSTSYLISKDGKIKYKTNTNNLISVQPDLELRPKIDPLIVYKGRTEFFTVDENIKFKHFLNYGFGPTSTNYLPVIYRANSTSAFTYRLDSKNYYDSKFPIDFGLNLNYEFGYWEDSQIGTVTFKSLNWGPVIRWSFWKGKTGFWNLHFGAFKSIFHKAVKEPDTHEFSTLGLLIDLERAQKTRLGTFLFGAGYRQSQSSIKNSTEYLENLSVKGSNKTITFTVGYLFDWDLSWSE